MEYRPVLQPLLQPLFQQEEKAWGEIEEVGRHFQIKDDSSDMGSLVIHCSHLVCNAMLFFIQTKNIF